MSDVTPNFKVTVDCPCELPTCTVHGLPLKSGHVRGCACRRCIGGRNRRQGVSRQRRFTKTAGIVQAKHRSQMGNEESFNDPWRWEIKSGKQVDPILTRFLLARDQSEASRAIGDNRPFAMGVEPTEQRNPSLVIVTAEDWRRHIVPLIEEYGGTAA